MRPLLITFGLVLALATAGAHTCQWTTSTTDERAVVLEVPGWETTYVVNDLCNVPRVEEGPLVVWFGHPLVSVPTPVHPEVDCLYSIWLYQETNGIAGLQRWDDAHDDTCGGQIEADGFWW